MFVTVRAASFLGINFVLVLLVTVACNSNNSPGYWFNLAVLTVMTIVVVPVIKAFSDKLGLFLACI